MTNSNLINASLKSLGVFCKLNFNVIYDFKHMELGEQVYKAHLHAQQAFGYVIWLQNQKAEL